ncbi:DEKNAAC105279 [Brettanomyces naardenensis]|uniref:DEKNAAC105279 n=1 Tax=Brettanomyces naardenensis TaxID=13370 RepID=A0A448YSP5_BRENA|nr:DEKNAAC105279 [Brettanomyces naardenensis]
MMMRGVAVYIYLLFLSLLPCYYANTETALVDRTIDRSVDANTVINEFLSETKAQVIGIDEGRTETVVVNFEPMILVKPENHQSRTILVDLSSLEYGFKYFVKVCWSAINPIDISLTTIKDSVLVITATTNYYSTDLAQTEKYLTDVKIQLQVSANNRFYGLLNDEFVRIAGYLIALTFASIVFSRWFYGKYFAPAKSKIE